MFAFIQVIAGLFVAIIIFGVYLGRKSTRK